MSTLGLNRPLVLEAPLVTANGSGGYDVGWAALGTLWAEVIPRTGREVKGPASSASVMGFKITVRGAPVGSAMRPQAGQRFREGTRHYRIEAVSERDPRGRFLVCFAEEEVAA
ncbi:head-tail adaptor [Primorskyibacter sedentarius]|uniref:Head-tail adaptor n=1 Tax=Primorskyibacter sedentarius TaxID=745311 RepID=A0A4V2UNZ0_9RHOB|nr:head-tail adaptor protein [Primorskyibacter sedentarius]TCS63801.1 head-tail adaptor [Primorskyibacter sedentarius]